MKKLITCLSLLLFSSPFLFAEDFTFNIPYNTYAIPQEIKLMRIQCVVYDSADQYGNQVAFAEQDISIPPGGDSGTRTIQLKFNANPGVKPEKGISYKCTIYEPFNKFIAQSSIRPGRIEVLGLIKRSK